MAYSALDPCNQKVSRNTGPVTICRQTNGPRSCQMSLNRKPIFTANDGSVKQVDSSDLVGFQDMANEVAYELARCGSQSNNETVKPLLLCPPAIMSAASKSFLSKELEKDGTGKPVAGYLRLYDRQSREKNAPYISPIPNNFILPRMGQWDKGGTDCSY